MSGPPPPGPDAGFFLLVGWIHEHYRSQTYHLSAELVILPLVLSILRTHLAALSKLLRPRPERLEVELAHNDDLCAGVAQESVSPCIKVINAEDGVV